MTDLREHIDRPAAAAPPPASGPGGGRAMPAGKALVIMATALAFAAVFNSRQFVAAAEGMPFGWQRTALLNVAKPVDTVARALRLDRPRAALDSALGRSTAPAGGGGFSGTLPGPITSPGAVASPGPSASAAPVVPTAPAFRDVSAAAPLKLFVTGDSMIEFMAPKLIASGGAAVTGTSEVKYGTGLVRDDFFDWPRHARAQMAARDPEAVIMLMGGNDGQNIQLRDRRILQAGSPEWTAEYQRRATLMMQIFTGGGKRHLYWVGMPIAKSARLTRAYRALDSALAAAARAVPGVTYVDIWGDFAPEGRYTDFLTVDGRKVLVRARDGIHVNGAGASLLSRKLHALLDSHWKLAG